MANPEWRTAVATVGESHFRSCPKGTNTPGHRIWAVSEAVSGCEWPRISAALSTARTARCRKCHSPLLCRNTAALNLACFCRRRFATATVETSTPGGRHSPPKQISAYKNESISQDCARIRRFRTDDRCHLPPDADRTPRSFKAVAISARLTAPDLRTASKVGCIPRTN